MKTTAYKKITNSGKRSSPSGSHSEHARLVDNDASTLVQSTATAESRARKPNAEISLSATHSQQAVTTDEFTGLSSRLEAVDRLVDHWAAANRPEVTCHG